MPRGDVNPEDIERKNPEEIAQIYKRGGKYFCASCQVELPFRETCPICKRKVDWNTIDIERRGP